MVPHLTYVNVNQVDRKVALEGPAVGGQARQGGVVLLPLVRLMLRAEGAHPHALIMTQGAIQPMT